MGCLWERRYGTNRTNPPRQKRIPIPTGQITVRRNRKGRRPIRLQPPREPSPKPDRKTVKERKNNQKDNKNAQKRGKENLIRSKSVAPNLNIYAKHAPILHIYRISYTPSQPNGKSIGSERFYVRRTKWRRPAGNGKRHG